MFYIRGKHILYGVGMNLWQHRASQPCTALK